MREIRMSGSMRGGRKRAFARRACLLLYRAPNSAFLFQDDQLSTVCLIQSINSRHLPHFHSHSSWALFRPVHDEIRQMGAAISGTTSAPGTRPGGPVMNAQSPDRGSQTDG
jgi:hypothetical protein